MASRTAYLGLALAALNACTITIQTAPQPANAYYPSQPVAVGEPVPVPVAGQTYPVSQQPALRPGYVAAAPVARPVPVASRPVPVVWHPRAAAPSPPFSAVRPPPVLRGPGQPPTTVYHPPSNQAQPPPQPVATQPGPLAPPVAVQPQPMHPTPGPVAPPVRRPVNDAQKADPRDKANGTQVK